MLRGTVTDNQDPMERGRVRVQVWGVHKEEDENLPWAEVMGCTAFPLHQGSGVAQVIPVGATVWVDFEHNDMNCPVVLGIFVGHQADTMEQANPGNSDFQGGAGSGSSYGKMMSMNIPGVGGMVFDGVKKTVSLKTGALEISMDQLRNKVEISNGLSKIEMQGPITRMGTVVADRVIQTGGLGGFF